MSWKQIPCSIYRGGTSKGLFLCGIDLPVDPDIRDRTILSLFGSPDSKQIDGLGGATPTTSKLAIVEVSNRPDADVDYTFGQVSIDKASIDYKPNCGNISSAVGPFALRQGMVEAAADGFLSVRIYNTNTNSIIVSRFKVENGQFVIDGDTEIPGVPGSGSPIYLDFFDEGGGVTGSLFPTGNRTDFIRLTDGSSFHVTIIDVGNLTVIMDGDELGFSGTEVTEDEMRPMLTKMENIRVAVGRMIGLFADDEIVAPSTHALPKIAIIQSPKDYRTTMGKQVASSEYDIAARVLTMGKLHPTYAVTGGIALSASSKFPDTLTYKKCSFASKERSHLKIGHPAGILEMEAQVSNVLEPKVEKVTLIRTARPLMEGQALVPECKEVVS
ncbi:PrpF protein [Alicyclobacillus fastidiosus]|uniref:PrpF protein n=1 Tax=Alicyclobacillus fastidiosus TaxID=392011 RepID=A0ABY6ZEN9_9BACL|nr:PrpF domain-containing protein [Alicyclobacillus fastidiosus]WAH41363.1 PrpF protein [Alicyclobacillus fastidiosus]GMA62974.1 putative isomerase YraM [Alicyclobacillus fastidiosus]